MEDIFLVNFIWNIEWVLFCTLYSVFCILKFLQPPLNRLKRFTVKLWLCDVDTDWLEDLNGWDASSWREESDVVLDHSGSFPLIFFHESKWDKHTKWIGVAIKWCGENMRNGWPSIIFFWREDGGNDISAELLWFFIPPEVEFFVGQFSTW